MSHEEFNYDDDHDDDCRLPGVFDPDDWYYGTPPPLNTYLTWTDHSVFARRLMLLVAQVDHYVMGARAKWRTLRHRKYDEIPF